MDGTAPTEGESSDSHVLAGEQVEPEDLEHLLAKSLVRFVTKLGGREIRLDEARKLESGIEALALTIKTGSPQEPAFDILPSEQLAVLLQDNAPPLVVPLRTAFPATPHTFGLPVEAPLSARNALCIDDRPWRDARADYNGTEIIRRISSWFRRAGTGQMDEEMQFHDPAFLPSPETLVMPSALERTMDAEG